MSDDATIHRDSTPSGECTGRGHCPECATDSAPALEVRHMPGTPVIFTVDGIRWRWSCSCGASSGEESFAKEAEALDAGRGHFANRDAASVRGDR